MLAVLLLAVTASCRSKVLHLLENDPEALSPFDVDMARLKYECPRWRAELEAYAERLEGRKCLNPKQCIESAVRALESVLSSEVASARQQNMTLVAT
jgi:hypothetical protein